MTPLELVASLAVELTSDVLGNPAPTDRELMLDEYITQARGIIRQLAADGPTTEG